MATYRICKYCGDLHDVADWPGNHLDPEPARSALPSPHVISDTMPPVQSQVDGRIYDSKSRIRATYQPSGNREGKLYVEVGNDPARHRPFKRQPTDRKAIRDALERSAARVARGEYTERGKRIDITRPGGKAPKHVAPNGPPIAGGVSKPAFK